MKLFYLGLQAALLGYDSPAAVVEGFSVVSRPAAVPRTSAATVSSTTRLSASSPTATETSDLDTSLGTNGDAVDGMKSGRRPLGGQELLMLPRQYKLDSAFPPMSHVSVAVLSKTPTVDNLERALEDVMRSHPLLRSTVEGNGEPDERIDAFDMVRRGDPDPPTFVEQPDGLFKGKDVLTVVDVSGEEGEDLDDSWRSAFRYRLDHGVENGGDNVLWNAELHTGKDGRCALILAFNHAISDQSSANLMFDHILSALASIEGTEEIPKAIINPMPESLERAMLGDDGRSKGVGPNVLDGFTPATAAYVAGKAAEGSKSPVVLPDEYAAKQGNPLLNALTTITGRAAGGETNADEGAPGCAGRKSVVQFRTLSEEDTSLLLDKCRKEGVTISNALGAAAALTASDFIGTNDENGQVKSNEERNYKVLQSLDMRRYESEPYADDASTVGCHAGSMDLMVGPLKDGSGSAIRSESSGPGLFWDLAKDGRSQTSEFVEGGQGPREAVRVFDAAMQISDMNNLVHLTAMSEASQGRAYSAGVTNVGVYERQGAVRREGQGERDTLKTKHGNYEIQDLFFATSHARTGCLYQVSCLTVDGRLSLTFHPASPLVPDDANAAFADAFVDLLSTVAESDGTGTAEPAFKLPEGLLTNIALAGSAGGLLAHAPAWAEFFRNVQTMRDNVADPADFWAALNFWIFFAVGHPLLQPVLWISDVLHGTPGPKIADLVPALFLAGNALVIGAVASSKELQRAVNVAALGTFFAYVGAGLDGQAGLGDFNLQLNDGYKGAVVRGCPTYDQVRQPSMDNFDLDKYQGKWYEQKFHDWTQFKEVYDTTLDIKLTEDGKGWIDDFAVKGPAPKSAVLSWDKSPVANGAHYFLFGRVDANDPPGVLRESGFGVEFPNYIVDVKKDAETGEYTEAIQFQCLERGGVRVFEGINFMSRNPTMSEGELKEMHRRAERAGMYPYGADPDQMHTVERRPESAPPLDNSWQRMWHAIGFDALLELLAESIEDGGR